MVDVDFGNSDERRDQLADNRVTILLNLANCFLRQVDDRAKTVGLDDRTAKLQGAVDLCTKILSISPTSPKALYRRGLAREKLEQLEDAADDLRACRKLSPKDKQVKSALARVIEGSKRQRRVREAGFRGSIPAQPTTTASRHRCNRQIDRIWSLTGVATDFLCDPVTIVPVGTFVLSACYCFMFKGWTQITTDHLVALFGLCMGAVMWAMQEQSEPLEFSSDSSPKLKVVDEKGNTKFEMDMGKPGSGVPPGGEADLAKFEAAVSSMGNTSRSSGKETHLGTNS